MILGYLVLAHLLADFIFQPSKLVIWKIRSKYGVLVHVLVHFVMNLIVLSPFIANGYYWPIGASFMVCFAHFWIDQAKINYDLKHDKKVLAFLIDQLMHLLVMMIVYFFVQNLSLSLPAGDFYSIYSDIRVIIFFSFLILCSSAVEIYHFQKVRERKHDATLRLHPRNIALRIFVFTLVYILFMVLSYFARNGGN
jgi:hypothetical protein